MAEICSTKKIIFFILMISFLTSINNAECFETVNRIEISNLSSYVTDFKGDNSSNNGNWFKQKFQAYKSAGWKGLIAGLPNGKKMEEQLFDRDENPAVDRKFLKESVSIFDLKFIEQERTNKKPTVVLDLDNTLVRGIFFRNDGQVGDLADWKFEARERMVKQIKQLKKEGVKIVVWTFKTKNTVRENFAKKLPEEITSLIDLYITKEDYLVHPNMGVAMTKVIVAYQKYGVSPEKAKAYYNKFRGHPKDIGLMGYDWIVEDDKNIIDYAKESPFGTFKFALIKGWQDFWQSRIEEILRAEKSATQDYDGQQLARELALYRDQREPTHEEITQGYVPLEQISGKIMKDLGIHTMTDTEHYHSA